jgi:serine/threonine-protein kinase
LVSEPGRFGRYLVEAEIGGGATARVYRALDPESGRRVAIKAIRTELLQGEAGHEALVRFRREARAVGGLAHPAIVTVLDAGDDYLVLELLEGRSLAERLKEQPVLPPAEVVELLRPVADALDHAHACGVVHRDVKPANVMLLAAGGVKLMDFGVAHLESSILTAEGESFGSPAYMAPEQIRNTDLTPRADVYSLAVIAFEALVGRRPFVGNVGDLLHRVATVPPPAPRSLNPGLPEAMDVLFSRALAKEPARRPASAGEFLQELATCGELRSTTTATLTLPGTRRVPREPRAGAATWARAGIVPGVVLLAALLAALIWRGCPAP